jgi:protein-S-isoprenylcysteine O-methyltransferase Ste14
MPVHAYIIVATGWIVWMAPFLMVKRSGERPTMVDRRARWGVLLQGLAYALLWQSTFWLRSPETWRIAVSVFFFILAAILSWTGTRALGRQWRIDAGLNRDHELIRSGPYSVVRHPIYSSMFCMLLATGFMVTPWFLLLASVLVFLVGAEIRVRVEDALLQDRFGDKFEEYRRGVSAYIPYVR